MTMWNGASSPRKLLWISLATGVGALVLGVLLGAFVERSQPPTAAALLAQFGSCYLTENPLAPETTGLSARAMAIQWFTASPHTSYTVNGWTVTVERDEPSLRRSGIVLLTAEENFGGGGIASGTLRLHVVARPITVGSWLASLLCARPGHTVESQ